MIILVLNCGSSSLKYQLIDSVSGDVLAKGLCERIGIEEGMFTYQKEGCDKVKTQIDQPDHKASVALVLNALIDPENGVIKSLDEIGAVGHRIVHGAEDFSKATLITDEMLKIVESHNDLAPLHNPANIIGVNACRALMPNTPMVGVFDTAFHQTMPPEAYIYGIPYEYYEKDKVRKYGFHGTSHAYVSKRTAELAGLDYENSKIIVCHLGNGASICAVENGKSVETSMGLTPMMGLVMGTRAGEIDPGVIEYIGKKENMTFDEIMNMLNKKSGMLGLSELSSDFRDIDEAIEEGNERAALAKRIYLHRLIMYVGGYIAVMNGVDAIAFTAGVGENDPDLREDVIKSFAYLGAYVDPAKNKVRGKETIISTDDSKVKVLLVPTNEELMIARETKAVVEAMKK